MDLSPVHPCLLFKINTFPQSEEIIFESHFLKEYLCLKETSKYRSLLLNALKRGDATKIIESCENYFPRIYGYAVSVESDDTLRLKTPLVYIWTSAFDSKPKKYSFNSHIFELIMCLLSYSYANMNKACELENKSNFMENYTDITTYLKKAYSTFSYILEYEIPYFENNKKEMPMDINIQFLNEMKKYSHAMIQNVLVKKVQIESKNFVPSYSLGVYQYYSNMSDYLKNNRVFISSGNKEYWRLIEKQKNLAYSHTFYIIAAFEYSENRFGSACGYISASFDKIGETDLKPYKDFIYKLKESYINENSSVHHQLIPNIEYLKMPDVKYILITQEWAPPEPGYTKLSK
jgi:hypothetical protein